MLSLRDPQPGWSLEIEVLPRCELSQQPRKGVKVSQFLFKMSRECVGDRQERRMWSWLTHNWATERESRKAQSQDTQEEKKKRASQMVLVVKKVKVKSSVMSDSLQACGI